MKTVLTKIVDGYEIITGFDRAFIDPVETAQIAEQKLNKSPIMIKIDQALQELNSTDRDKPKFQELYANFQRLLKEMEQNRQQLIKDNIVYFEPKQGEEIISEEKADTLKAKFADLENAQLTKDGKIIPDYREHQYWIKGDKWQEKRIKKLGEKIPSNGIHPDDLKESQKDEIGQELFYHPL